MANISQMLKGFLEGCILEIVNKKETYGYEICETLVSYGFSNINEGSVYPLLIRLEKKGLIYFMTKESRFGPMRKYYHLTEDGSIFLCEFVATWKLFRETIDKILEG